MRVTVRLFARLRETAGTASVVQEVPDGATVETLWQALADRFPGLQPLRPSVAAAVDDEFARFATPLRDGQTVALLPPVSGG